MEHKQNF